MSGHVVIVGAGHGGGALAALLRAEGHGGRITLIGSEPVLPYQRPPLSKAWLSGEANEDALTLRPAEYYRNDRIDLRLATEVTSIDGHARQVHTDRGDTIEFDHLVLATGAAARPLAVPGTDLPNVASLRDMQDATRLQRLLASARSLVIIGGGYIGLEVAASVRKLGHEVVVVEREQRLLARVACQALSDFFQSLHAARGVRFHFSASIEAIEPHGEAARVRLTDGTDIVADVVLVGVGGMPRDALARGAGLECSNGVVVDGTGRTSHPAIFALGDVTFRPLPLYGRMARLESVPNALEQGRQICAAILGSKPPAPEVPWFWSDQYDVKLQIAGVAFEADLLVLRGHPPTDFSRRPDGFALFHMLAGRVVAVEAINAPAEFMAGRKLIASARTLDAGSLADTTVPLRNFLT